MKILVIAAAALLAASVALADTTTTRQGGTADFACCEDANCTTPIGSQYSRDWAAKDACAALVEADGKTRYFRQWPMRIDKVGVPPPVTCPPAPAPTTATMQCPSGTVGTWTQTTTSTVGPPPTCTVTTAVSPYTWTCSWNR